MRLPKDLKVTRRKDGRWVKKIDGKPVYLGRGSEEEARRQLIEHLAGHAATPAMPATAQRPSSLHDRVTAWLDQRSEDVAAGRLTPHSLYEYRLIAKLLMDLNDQHRLEHRETLPADVRRAVTVNSPAVTKKRCVLAQTLLRAAGLEVSVPKPSKAEIRRYRATRPRKLVSAEDVSKLLSAACPTMRAALLLGINCGFHSVDVARLEWRHITSEGLIDWPRCKTGIARQCPLGPKTLAALHDADFNLPGPILRTPTGKPLIVDHETGGQTRWFDRSVPRLRTRAKVPDFSFSWLRSTFRTIADEHPDINAVRRIMGHELGQSCEATYIQRVGHDRLVAVVSHVWESLGISAKLEC